MRIVSGGEEMSRLMELPYLVARHLPATLGNELRNTLVDVRAGGNHLVLFNVVSQAVIT